MASRFLNSMLLGAAALGAGSGPVQAQANPLLGSWAINFAAGTRIENGTPTTITGTGWLVVQLQGDSIIARLIPDPMDGATRPETRMAAVNGAGKVVFVHRGQAHVNMNGEEIQQIVDDLFVGNKLAAGMIQTSDGANIDLRNIRSPIVVFCSKGDNITPPQQALGWILDLYESHSPLCGP